MELIEVRDNEPKHAKQELTALEPEEEVVKFVADVPADAYYKEQIRTLQKKLDDLQTHVELKDSYIADLEKRNEYLTERVVRLERAVVEAAIKA